jgi:hypothetical protein
MHRALLENLVVVIIVVNLLLSLERSVVDITRVDSVLNSKFDEIDYVLALFVRLIPSPELIVQASINILLVSIRFVEHVFVRLRGKLVLQVCH